MRVFQGIAILIGVSALVALGATDAVAAKSPLTLKAGGVVAAVGTPVAGVLRFGPCGTLESSGTLTANNLRKDVAELPTVEKEGNGGCGEGAPYASGQIRGIEVSAAGVLTVVGDVIYTVELPEHCVYKLKKLKGAFTIPGLTQAVVSGVGARSVGSAKGCEKKLQVEDAEAELEAQSTGEPLEAEL